MAHPVAEADEKSPFGSLTPEEFYARHGVVHSSSTFVNPRGLRIFTQRWVPAGDAPLLGAIAVVHGFTGESSWTSRFEEVELPLLVVHGGDDTVCDPGCAEELHRRAGSKDKTLHVYPGMWHQLVGEPDENVEKVFGDVLDWLKSHAAAAAAAE
uniref:Serine aminopeptidase S33 domain-containing protein n=1 Tax=Oryza brachyantha TaxID=4533 RepID=J3KZA1_ORYBR